ncbi:helicase [Malassezia cuniculi]|uniref:Helicase n=1 Tax=Malassezia cuniculi TaxID=948313 RepID=A0AAF0EQW3_9BASI|nr:helicase [Malassezia cuniculi]
MAGRRGADAAWRIRIAKGNEVYVGGKEVLIDRPVGDDGHEPEQAAPPRPTIPYAAAAVRRRATPTSQFYATPRGNAPTRRAPDAHPRYDPNAPGAIVMKRPCQKHQELYGKGLPVVDVVLDPELARVLRPHQIEGVRFLYEAVVGMAALEHQHSSPGQGAILADEMGLGKTLQTIALVLTLLRQSCYYSSVTRGMIDKVLIVCPLSLVSNWRREFRRWIGRSSVGVLAVEGDGRTEVARFVSGSQYQVLILGYERLRNCAAELAKSQKSIGLIVCDEGHRLKSANAKTTRCFDVFSTKRRVLLTGTPIQNDLREFYAMVDFVYPGLFDEYAVFRRVFEEPIIRSRQQHCSPDARALGKARSRALMTITKGIILRRTSSILSRYLPPRHDLVLFCQMPPVQRVLYSFVLSYVHAQLASGKARTYLPYIMMLRQLCNAPELVVNEDEASDADAQKLSRAVCELRAALKRRTEWAEASESGKLHVLLELLATVRTHTGDRVIIVSNFTKTLDMLQRCCTRQGYPVIRLDGRTRQDERTRLVASFNSTEGEDDEPFIFLLSAKSGGVGLNLIGANRLVLYDSDWNPSTDQQAMARIHRDGQMKPCFIYRMLLSGSIDEKIYQRQLTKMGLSDTLIGEGTAGDSFSQEDLRDIFMLEDTKCLTHDLLECLCGGDGSEAKVRTDDREKNDGKPPGFMTAKEHTRITAKQQSMQLAAQLGNQRHYDMLAHPGKFVDDDMLRYVASRQQLRRAEALEHAEQSGEPTGYDDESKAALESVLAHVCAAGARLAHSSIDIPKLARDCTAITPAPGELAYLFAHARSAEVEREDSSAPRAEQESAIENVIVEEQLDDDEENENENEDEDEDVNDN